MKMHELLSTEKRWTQHASARDEFGDVTSSMSRNAVSFCLLGALDRCYAQAQFSKRAAALNALVSKCGVAGLTFLSGTTRTGARSAK
jgi:hypothetical protein